MGDQELTRQIIGCAYAVHNTLGHSIAATNISINFFINFASNRIEVKRKYRDYTPTD